MPKSIKPLVCVDSSIVLPLVIEHPLSDAILHRWQIWKTENRGFIGPFVALRTSMCCTVTVAWVFSQSSACILEAALVQPYAMMTMRCITRQANRPLPITCRRLRCSLCCLSATYARRLLDRDKRLYNSIHPALPWVYLLQESEADCHLPEEALST